MQEQKDVKYPFLISNNHRSNKSGTHRWGILDSHPKREIFFFDTFGILGLWKFSKRSKNNRIEKMQRKANKLTLAKTKFPVADYKLILK